MNKLPRARSVDVVIQKLDREILIYDLKTDKAYSLNETSAIVYQSCDGETSFDDLRSGHRFTDDLIFLALDELKRENLIEADKALVSPLAGMSRREAIRRAGLGTMIALPLISSLTAPTAAHAQSADFVCSETSCICGFPSGDATSTSCTSEDCGVGCVCRVNRDSCSILEEGGTICFGNCGSDVSA